MKLKVRKKASTENVEEVIGIVSHLRLPHITRPKFVDTLIFPNDITALDSANISELLGKYTKLYAFVNYESARLARKMLELESRATSRRHELLIDNPRWNTIEKHKRENLYNTDETLSYIRLQKTRAEMDKIITDSYVSNYDKYIAALSRELTRKGTEDSYSMRFQATSR